MAFLFTASGFTGYLGWQWRRVRTIPDEVAALKATLPKAPAAGARARATPALARRQHARSAASPVPSFSSGTPADARAPPPATS